MTRSIDWTFANLNRKGRRTRLPNAQTDENGGGKSRENIGVCVSYMRILESLGSPWRIRDPTGGRWATDDSDRSKIGWAFHRRV